MINYDAKSNIVKCFACTNESYSYALSFNADFLPDFKRMITKQKKIIKSKFIVQFSLIDKL